MEKIITYFNQPTKINCDERCDKAWGSNKRPRFYIELGESRIFGYGYNDGSIYPDDEVKDVDNWAYLADGELGTAPVDPGTYEGIESTGKPKNKEEIPNKWCVRECERCAMSSPGNSHLPLKIRDFISRRYNIPSEDPTKTTVWNK